jgi:acetyl esterase/lipase
VTGLRGPGRPLLVRAVLLLLAAVVAACGGSPTVDRPTSTPHSSAAVRASAANAVPTSVEYAPGLTEDLYLPQAKGRVPLVVMVPGGGWRTADPSGLEGLAASLAVAGIAAAPTHIRAAKDGVVYPVPVEDVLCAVRAAAAEVTSRGLTPGPVVILGHSSGAHLAALAVLAVDDYSPKCSAPAVQPDALIGLSGPYDISQLPEIARPLLGTNVDEDPVSWRAANPFHRADLRPHVPVLLLHGEADRTVPVAFTTQFAQALKDAGHPMTVELVPSADHQSIYTAEVSAERIAQWVLQLSSTS